MVPGAISRCSRSRRGSRCTNAASTARSARSSRGCGFTRRNTATSCRSTSSSTSFAADDRPNSANQSTIRTKIRYSSRNATLHDHAPMAHGARLPQLNSPRQDSGTPQGRPGREEPRHRPRRRGHPGRSHRCPDPVDERDHGTLDPELPPRTPRPHSHLEPAPPTPRPTRVRAVLQHPPPPPRHRQRPTTTRAATTHRRSNRGRPTRHPPAATTGWHPQRVPPRRLACTDGIFGKRRAGHVRAAPAAAGPCPVASVRRCDRSLQRSANSL